MSTIKFLPSDPQRLHEYWELYKICFPNSIPVHRTSYLNYLKWIYEANPEGKVIGMDALNENNEIVGRTSAIPVCFNLKGSLIKALISIHSAIHPAFQGRFLFKKLGLALCEEGAQKCYSCVLGVSNAKSTISFIRQMKFQLVSPLKATLGIGSLNISQETLKSAQLHHHWTQDALKWRASNPINPVSFRKIDQTLYAYASTTKIGNKGIFPVVAEFPSMLNVNNFKPATLYHKFFPKLFIGLVPKDKGQKTYFDIPQKFKPSPLNLVYKNLIDPSDKLDPTTCFFNFLDFDAF